MNPKTPQPFSRADAALDRVVVLQAEIDALTARRTEAIREFAEAFDAEFTSIETPLRERSRRAELACALRVPERTAERLIGEARVLIESLPATFASLAEGSFSYRHAQVMVNELAGLEPAERAAVERLALGRARTQTAARFTRTVRTLRERRVPEAMAKRCATAFLDRAVTIEPAADGMAYLTAYLGAVDAAAIHDRLTGAAHRHRADGDPRTVTQLRADVLADALLDRQTALDLGPTMQEALGGTAGELLVAQEASLGPFQGVVPTVIVTVPVQTLLGGDEPGTLEGVGPIDPVTARRLTAETPSLYRLLTHPETGVALSLSRASYQIPDGLRRWLRVRDGSCRFPGCNIRTHRSDIDHTRDWQHDGRSDHGNLAHLSRGHHTLKHHGGWRVTQPRPGVLHWTSPLGRRYETLPDTG
ncbi:MAG: DUF222 domain-containing protein [Protaetiibacter sp.]